MPETYGRGGRSMPHTIWGYRGGKDEIWNPGEIPIERGMARESLAMISNARSQRSAADESHRRTASLHDQMSPNFPGCFNVSESCAARALSSSNQAATTLCH